MAHSIHRMLLLSITDNGKINFIVGESVQLPINVNGNEVFGNEAEEDNLFVTVNNIMKALTEGDTEELSSNWIT